MKLYQNDLPDDLKFVDSVAVDTETMGLVLARDRLCLVQLCSSDGKVCALQIHKDQLEKSENLKRLLSDKSVLKIFHFARFDVSMLRRTFGVDISPIYCTKIASKLVRTYTDRHGLKNLCKEILGIDISKQEQTSDWGREELSPEQLKYAAGDVLYLHSLKSELDKMLQRENKSELAKKCFRALETICRLEVLGFSPEEVFQH